MATLGKSCQAETSIRRSVLVCSGFVGLTDELLNNLVLEKINRDAKRDDQKPPNDRKK